MFVPFYLFENIFDTDIRCRYRPLTMEQEEVMPVKMAEEKVQINRIPMTIETLGQYLYFNGVSKPEGQYARAFLSFLKIFSSTDIKCRYRPLTMKQEEVMPIKMAEEKVQINRVLMIDEMIRSGIFPSIDKLARKAEVTKRTIERDIEYLRDIYHAPIEYDHKKRGYYYSEPNFFIKSVILTEGELFSIALFDRLLEQYRNTPLEAALRQIFDKIIRAMPDRITVDTGLLGPQISVISDHQGFIDPEVFERIFTALKSKRTVTFNYRPLHKITYMERTVDPYHAICQRANWYFIGHCHYKNEPRMFSFSRIKNALLTDRQFDIPSGFKPEMYFDRKMGVFASAQIPYAVELLIADAIGTYALERQWHDTQTVEQREDGSVYVKFTTTQTPEVLRWVLGQGHTVKVLNPPELMEQVKDEVEKMRRMYT